MKSATPERMTLAEEISGLIERVTFFRDNGFCGLRANPSGTGRTARPLTPGDPRGQPGLSRAAMDSRGETCSPQRSWALRLHGVGRKTTKRLLALGLLIDPEAVQYRALAIEEFGGQR